MSIGAAVLTWRADYDRVAVCCGRAANKAVGKPPPTAKGSKDEHAPISYVHHKWQ
jgi:hypothetical protein